MLLLFRAMDGARRAIRLGVVERIEDVAPECVRFSAGRLRVVLGDRILPLEGCTVAPEGAKLRVLRLSDGQAEIAYGFAEVIDVRSVAVELRAAASPGEIAGVFLLDGEQIEMLDPYWLFAAHATGAKDSRARTRRPVCALPSGDPWMEAMLRPLVESLGYQVVEAAEGVRADIIIASADDAPSAKAEGAHLVRIRSRPELGGENDNSIYRYDREALLSALATDIAEGGGHG
jgi:two-component system, chemotaxis family, sensor kinase CheA